MRRITSFRDEYRFLSNFFLAATMYDGCLYRSSEHAFVAAKTLNLAIRQHIAEIETPNGAKKFGRSLQLRPDWEKVKVAIMHQIVRDKFIKNEWLATKLIATGDAELIEGNNWGDRFWGMVWNYKGEWEGENHLGKILIRVREELG